MAVEDFGKDLVQIVNLGYYRIVLDVRRLPVFWRLLLRKRELHVKKRTVSALLSEAEPLVQPDAAAINAEHPQTQRDLAHLDVLNHLVKYRCPDPLPLELREYVQLVDLGMIVMIKHRDPSNHGIVLNDKACILRAELVLVKLDLNLFVPPKKVRYVLASGRLLDRKGKVKVRR